MSELLAALPDDIEDSVRALLDLACQRELAIVTAGRIIALRPNSVPAAARRFPRR
jgi:hypothetical protein